MSDHLENEDLQAIVDHHGEGPDGRMGALYVRAMAEELLALRSMRDGLTDLTVRAIRMAHRYSPSVSAVEEVIEMTHDLRHIDADAGDRLLRALRGEGD